MENALNHDYKNDNGRNFQLINSHLLTLPLPEEEVFQENGQSRPAANLPVVDFNFVPNLFQSLLNHPYYYANETVSVKPLSLICITSDLL